MGNLVEIKPLGGIAGDMFVGACAALWPDLKTACLEDICAAGVPEAEWIGQCTYADPERFFSYRRSVHQADADSGRLIATIRL